MIDSTPNKTNPWWNIAKIGLAIVLAGFVLSKADTHEFIELVKQISPFWLGVHILLFITLTLLKAWQYHSLIGSEIPYSKVLSIIITQNVLSNFLATTAGVASYIALFRAEHGVKIRNTVAIFILIKIGDLCALWAGLIISSVLVWQKISAVHNLISILVLGIGLALLFLLLLVFFRQAVINRLDLWMSRFKLANMAIIQKALSSLQVLSDTDPAQIKRVFLKALFPSTIYFCISILWIFSSYQAFNFQQDFQSIVFVSTLIQIVSYLPVQVFGGLGVTETSSLYFWSLFEIHQSRLASMLVGNRLLFYLLNLLPLIYLPLHGLFSGKAPGSQKDQGRH
jgi:uncharacterized protein (TIRG00374 family)